jgi:hypothetical protein
MDVSKLPRLSKTEVPRPSPMPAEGAAPERGAFCDRCGAGLRAGARFCDACGTPAANSTPTAGPGFRHDDEPPGAGLEVWISIGLGMLLLLLAPNALKWTSAQIFHTNFAPYVDPLTNQPADYILMTDGTKIPYRRQTAFWSDWVITAFAMALIFEGTALFFSRRPLVVLIALAVTILATAANLVYLVATYGQGLALLSAVAVLFGTVIAVFEWQLLRSLAARR